MLPVPFALAGSEAALHGLFPISGSATVLVFVNLAARFFEKIPPLFAALGVTGLALGSALPTSVVDGGGVRPRQWPESFRGPLYSVGLTPLALYERTTMFKRTPERRRDNPPRG